MAGETSDLSPDNIKTVYTELCNSYRSVDDFRGHLLGFLPLATGGLFLLTGKQAPDSVLLPVGIFGFVITLGLYIFEIYGTRRCTHLIALGQHLEGELKVEGQFRNRPYGLHRAGHQAWPFRNNYTKYISEPLAAGIIYPATAGAWLYLALKPYCPLGTMSAVIVFLVGFAASCKYSHWLGETDLKEKKKELLKNTMNLSSRDIRYGESTENMCGKGFPEEVEQEPAPPSMRAAFVKFVDGGCTKWHFHTGEQMLFATEGQGFVEFQYGPRLEIREGARVHIPVGVWHRHGAAQAKTLVHLAVTYGDTKWDDEDPCRQDSQRGNQLGYSVLTEIASLDQRILQAEEAGSTEELADLLAESFTIVRSSGEKIDRWAFLNAVPDHANLGRSASQAKVHLVCKECAVCTSVVTTTQNHDRTPNPGLFWNTQLFIRENGHWRCAEWQVIKISP